MAGAWENAGTLSAERKCKLYTNLDIQKEIYEKQNKYKYLMYFRTKICTIKPLQGKQQKLCISLRIFKTLQFLATILLFAAEENGSGSLAEGG